MGLKSRLIFRALAITCRSTTSCWCAAVALRICRECGITSCAERWMPRAWRIASRDVRSTARSGPRPRRRSKGAIKSNATQRTCFPANASDRPGLCQRHCGEVHLLDDVGRQEVDGAARVLWRDGPGGEEDQRRCLEDFQESHRERETVAGSEDPPRGRCELSGSGGSESVPQTVAGDSLAATVFAGARGQNDGGQARG